MTISKEEIVRLAHETNLIACVDDSYLDRNDWLISVEAFAAAIEARVREECVKDRIQLLSVEPENPSCATPYAVEYIRA